MAEPTTEDVRDAYQSTGEGLDFKRVWHERGAEFDYWLAERDRQAAERVWAVISYVAESADEAGEVVRTADLGDTARDAWLLNIKTLREIEGRLRSALTNPEGTDRG